MSYGPDKTRDMIRGILPSTARNSARTNLASAKRRNRRNIRMALHVIAVDPEVWDGCPTDLSFYPYEAIRDAVSERRDHDNISALRAWAPSQVEGIRPRDALTKLKGMLPDTTVGRHALTHIDDLPAFNVISAEDYHYSSRTYRFRGREIDFDYERVRAELQVILETRGAHRRLNGHLLRWYNAYTKYVPGQVSERLGWKTNGRYLKGAHDIEAFMTWYKHHYHDLRIALDKTAAGE